MATKNNRVNCGLSVQSKLACLGDFKIRVVLLLMPEREF